MIFVENIVKEFISKGDHDTALSTVCISTSNPVYLVFEEGNEYPSVVLRFANSDDVCETHKVMELLSPHVGDLIPKPLSIIDVLGGQKVCIQEGAKGMPWFQIASRFSTEAQWNELRVRALSALNQLQVGVSLVDGWKASLYPGDELRSCLRQCLDSGTSLSGVTIGLIDKLSCELDAVGSVDVYPQHGDFCLNNLLVGAESMHVIDFEDFSMTAMPLFDEVSLALSIYSHTGEGGWGRLREELCRCTEVGMSRFNNESNVLFGFFAYHLLVRLGKWSQGGQRNQFREWLLVVLDEFVAGVAGNGDAT